MDSKRKEDILLVGAGLTGLTFCNFLKNSKLKITILDSNPEKFYKEADNTRYIVLSNTSKKILSKLDLWKDLAKHCSKIENIHISKKNIFGNTIVKAEDENLDSLGYQIPLKTLLNSLYKGIKKSKNINFINEAKAVGLNQESVASVNFRHKNIEKEIYSNSVIFSSGSLEKMFESYFEKKIEKNYEQNAVVCEILTDISDSTTAFERFTNDGILGVIPRKNNSWTLIYSTNNQETSTIKSLDKKNLKSYFQKLLKSKCGNILQVKNLQFYPLKLQYYPSFSNKNICLIGDAAHTLHPIAGQSFNLTVRDCLEMSTLIEESLTNDDINFIEIFSKFEANRKKEVQRIVRFTDFLASFVHGKSIVKNKFITLSLLSIDMNRNLRTNIIRYLLGINFSDKLITKMESK